MIVLVNEEDQNMVYLHLKADPELIAVARAHSNDMFVRGYFAHEDPDGKDPFERMKEANVHFLNAGENLALAQTLSIAHNNLMILPVIVLNSSTRFWPHRHWYIDGGFYGLMISQEFRD